MASGNQQSGEATVSAIQKKSRRKIGLLDFISQNSTPGAKQLSESGLAPSIDFSLVQLLCQPGGKGAESPRGCYAGGRNSSLHLGAAASIRVSNSSVRGDGPTE